MKRKRPTPKSSRKFVDYSKRAVPLEVRFWAKVAKAGPDDCWDWTGWTKKGYGRIETAKNWERTSLRAHRVSWEIHNGPIPGGKQVLHHCDRGICVNPAHLFLGTHKDNMADMYAKGRNPPKRGEKHGMSKLREAEVRDIFFSAPYTSQKELAARYGVTVSCVSNILCGRTWRHLNLVP